MKMKRTVCYVLAGVCWLLAAPPVSATEGALGGKDWNNEGKLQIDLNHPQTTDQENQRTLTILEQWGIQLFTPQADARVSANKEAENNQMVVNRENIFVNDTGVINQTVEKSRGKLFTEPVHVNRDSDYQVRKSTPQPPSQRSQILSQFLLLVAGVVLLASAVWTWKNKSKKDWKEGMSHGSHTS